MKTELIVMLIAAVGLAAVPAALAQGCCPAGAAPSHAGCGMAVLKGGGAHQSHDLTQGAVTTAAPASRQVFGQPVQTVFDSYIKIQGGLAQDSLLIKNISSTAAEMAKAIRTDPKKALSPKLAEQAEALSQAKDLESARAAFKTLSESLINYLKDQKVPAGVYYVAYCPMAKASWLQTDRTILNPYMGKGMIHCGEIKS